MSLTTADNLPGWLFRCKLPRSRKPCPENYEKIIKTNRFKLTATAPGNLNDDTNYGFDMKV
jgi:hypothetical protein